LREEEIHICALQHLDALLEVQEDKFPVTNIQCRVRESVV
jgi:hypothetical protein